ncbi:MAG: glutamine--fructose-6-phosphate transaminase (isomerizing), partial [bacterium]
PRRPTQITWSAAMAEKAGFKHFMLKEIHEQPQAVEDTFRGRLRPDAGEVDLPDLGLKPDQVRAIEKVFLVACGTSYHAGLVARYWLEEEAGIPCEVDIASEFRYRNPIVPKNSLAVVITQSGETADTLAALREAKRRGARTLAICNAVGSTAAREADGVIYTHCGPEIGVASTKAFTGQLTALLLLTVALGRARGRMGVERAREILRHLLALPAALRAIVANQAPLKAWAKTFSRHANFLYLGRHVNYPIALEGALKLKEISYIHAEGYPAGEMKHGPIALIDKKMPVLTIATQSKVYPKVLSNIEEAHARDGIILALATAGDKEIRSTAKFVYEMPPTLEILTPIQNVVPLQLLAYYIAVRRKCDVDKPRNLAKSVTVE